jgi:predicted dehydrogenase
MRRRISVFVANPMAVTADEAEEMVRVADEGGLVLAVGLYRRLLPLTQILRSLMQAETWGKPRSECPEWGGMSGYASPPSRACCGGIWLAEVFSSTWNRTSTGIRSWFPVR